MLKNLINRHSRKVGLDSGTPLYTGDVPKKEVSISLIEYSQLNVEERQVSSISEAMNTCSENNITWINIDGLSNGKIMEDVGSIFKLHPLYLEDMLNTAQRPKFEDCGNYFFVILKMLYYATNKQDLNIEQVSLIVGENIVISIQEDKIGDVFDSVRERIRHNKGRIRKMKSDYLAYSLIDAIVDNYFVILEELGEKVENLETLIIKVPGPKVVEKMHYLKQKIIFLRKSIWPLREVIGMLIREENMLIQANTKIYLRDVYEHTIQVIEIIETCRDMVSGLLDIYLSSISNKLNEIMKVLTMISTIFIPLSFIASFYGMNFKFMPELDWKLGYPLVILVMLLISGTMLIFFKRKRWL